jgi:hypothetical protein
MEELHKAIIDRLEPWELVEFLQIPMEEILEAFEEIIEDKITDLQEFVGLTIDDEEVDRDYNE